MLARAAAAVAAQQPVRASATSRGPAAIGAALSRGSSRAGRRQTRRRSCRCCGGRRRPRPRS
eukprot:scaffold218_cov333-Prasinococcus_capsulatus_cf.AAC.11